MFKGFDGVSTITTLTRPPLLRAIASAASAAAVMLPSSVPSWKPTAPIWKPASVLAISVSVPP